MTYFDFAKAFDSVSRPKLVHKLQGLWFFWTYRLLNMSTDFRSARTQRVVLPRDTQYNIVVSLVLPKGTSTVIIDLLLVVCHKAAF